MHINIRTLKSGSHNVRIDGSPIISFSSDGGEKTAGRDVTMTERSAVAGAVAAHKGLCWSRGKCQGHDVTIAVVAQPASSGLCAVCGSDDPWCGC